MRYVIELLESGMYLVRDTDNNTSRIMSPGEVDYLLSKR